MSTTLKTYETAVQALADVRNTFATRINETKARLDSIGRELTALAGQHDKAVHASAEAAIAEVETRISELHSERGVLLDRLPILQGWKLRERAKLAELRENIMTAARAHLSFLEAQAWATVKKADLLRSRYLSGLVGVAEAYHAVGQFVGEVRHNHGDLKTFVRSPSLDAIEVSPEHIKKAAGTWPSMAMVNLNRLPDDDAGDDEGEEDERKVAV
jgi:hypothetical protein